nr:MAG TPA: hypothetical protein [Caudoviricetes sp.]
MNSTEKPEPSTGISAPRRPASRAPAVLWNWGGRARPPKRTPGVRM